jgi:aminopeptidase YwaD
VLAPAYATDVARAAQDAGAVGLLVPRGTDGDGWMPKMIAGPSPTGVAVLSVRTDLHHAMVTASRRSSVTASVPIRTVTVSGRNVHAVFAAPGAGAPSVLLSAHFDRVGDDPDVRFPPRATTPPVSPS